MQLTRLGRRLSLAVRSSVSVSFIALAACATTGGGSLSTGPSVQFQMSGGAGQTSATINKDGAQGPSIDLGRYDDGATLRGTVSGQPLQMAVSGNSAKGQWGNQPISVEVQEVPGQLKMNGLVAGQLSNWSATKEVIEGKIGVCSYQLGRVGTAYQGTSTCGGQTTVQFPSNILEWKIINIAVLMALLMSTP